MQTSLSFAHDRHNHTKRIATTAIDCLLPGCASFLLYGYGYGEQPETEASWQVHGHIPGHTSEMRDSSAVHKLYNRWYDGVRAIRGACSGAGSPQ